MNHSRVSKPGLRKTRPRNRPVTPRTYNGNTSNSYRNVLQRKLVRARKAEADLMFLISAGAPQNLINKYNAKYRLARLNYEMFRMN
jgi:hypothetical protein